MAHTVKLLSYIVKVNESRTKNFTRLDNMPDGRNMAGVLFGYLNEVNENTVIDESAEKVITKAELIKKTTNDVWGFVGGGDFGIEAEGVNIESGEHVFTREENETIEIPFYIHLRVFPGLDKGLMVVMQYGRRGIKTILENEIRDRFNQDYEDHTFKIHPIAPSSYIEQLISGGVRAVRFIKREDSGDEFDQFDRDGYPENYGRVKREFIADSNSILGISDELKSYIKGEINKDQLVEVTDIEHDDFENLKIEVRFGDSTRVIDVSRRETLTAKFDVTDEVDMSGGLPTLGSLHDEASGLLSDIAEDQGFTDEADRDEEVLEEV